MTNEMKAKLLEAANLLHGELIISDELVDQLIKKINSRASTVKNKETK